MKIYKTILRANALTDAGHVYPERTLLKIKDDFYLSSRMLLGSLSEPGDINRLALRVSGMTYEDEQLIAEIDILGTASGDVLQRLIHSGVELGFSPTGVGTVDPETKEVSNYTLYSVDVFNKNE